MRGRDDLRAIIVPNLVTDDLTTYPNNSSLGLIWFAGPLSTRMTTSGLSLEISLERAREDEEERFVQLR